jgi:hypothetical protein
VRPHPPAEMALVTSLDELAELVGHLGTAYVRFSDGPDADEDGTSTDGESGEVLPGLSVNPLTPEPWWHRPVRHWLARQVRQYAHLAGDGRIAWVLTGPVVGRGPDCEPLVSPFHPVAVLDGEALEEAAAVYHSAFGAGRRPAPHSH